jgi:hypothetical protein
MAQIRIQSTGQVVYEGEFRSLFPNTSLPQQLTEALINSLGGEVVFEGQQASPTRYQTAFADGVEQIDGKWYTKYSVADMGAEAIAALDANQATVVRKQRDEKLAETDWRYRRDQTTTQAWDDYCQALRDVPSQSGFPWEVTWPTKPE